MSRESSAAPCKPYKNHRLAQAHFRQRKTHKHLTPPWLGLPEVTRRGRCTSGLGLYGRALVRSRAALDRCLGCSGGFRRGKELRGRHRLRCAGRCATLACWSRTRAGDREDRAWERVGLPGSAVGSRPRRPTTVPAGRAAGAGMEKRSHACGSTGAVQLSRVTLLTPRASHPGCAGGGSVLLVTGDQ